MDDQDFEARLVRLFCEHEAGADPSDFARAVERRLGRSWALRRVLLASAGVAGGAIALVQAVSAGVAGGGRGLAQVGRALAEGVAALPPPPHVAALDRLPITPEAVWLILGLAILAGALFAGRSLEDL